MIAIDMAAQCLTDTGVLLERDVALAPYTSIRIGGPADWLAAISDVDELRNLVQWAQRIGIPYFVLGGGSNILVSDKGVRGLVILNRCKRLVFEEQADSDKMMLLTESGALMAGVARQTVQRKLFGLEWAVSLPGTVGGAVIGNAGAYGSEVKDNLVDARIVLSSGKVVQVDKQQMDYAYRDSALKRSSTLHAGFDDVVLDARFQLEPDTAGDVETKATEYLAHRRRSQPTEPSIGSTFKNPPGDYAGRLIEAAGLKGAQVGGVQVSNLHANFMVNRGGVGKATAADVMGLVELVQAAVYNKFHIELEPEIQLTGEWD